MELPLQVNSDEDAGEEIRLKNRFLDLRARRHANIMLRSNVIASLRRMIAQGFTEFQTPIPGPRRAREGARLPGAPRMHPGKFYALPQAPQQFKQLLMVGRFRPPLPDRAPLPRRGQLRRPLARRVLPARSEMSFVTQDDVFNATMRAGAPPRVRGIRRRPRRCRLSCSADPL